MDQGFINWRAAARISASAETGGEFILPNDLPDVKRTVHVLTQIKKNGGYIEDNDLSAEGDATYRILYVGDDGQLHSVSYTSGVTVRAVARDAGKAEICDAVFRQPDTSVRLANPRKFSVRCRVPADFTVYAKEEIAPYITGTQDQGLQFDEQNDVTYCVSEAREENIPYAEDLHIPEDLPEPDRLLTSYVTACLPTVSVSDGSAEISFRVDAAVLYLTEDGIPCSYRTSVDVSHVSDDDVFRKGSVCRASVTVDGYHCSLTTDKTGALRVVELDMTYSVCYLCDTPQTVTYVRDMYSTEKECTAVYADTAVRRLSPPYTTHFTVSKEEKKETSERALAATADVTAASLSSENGQCVCEGNIEVYIINENGGEYENKTVLVGFRTVLPYSLMPDSVAGVEAAVGIPSVRNEENRMFIDAEVYLTVSCEKEISVRTVKTFDISETPVTKRKPSLLISRPDNETMWDTAKKYRVPLAELEKANKDNNTSVRIIP